MEAIFAVYFKNNSHNYLSFNSFAPILSTGVHLGQRNVHFPLTFFLVEYGLGQFTRVSSPIIFWCQTD
jgi:hypothetical protein